MTLEQYELHRAELESERASHSAACFEATAAAIRALSACAEPSARVSGNVPNLYSLAQQCLLTMLFAIDSARAERFYAERHR